MPGHHRSIMRLAASPTLAIESPPDDYQSRRLFRAHIAIAPRLRHCPRHVRSRRLPLAIAAITIARLASRLRQHQAAPFPFLMPTVTVRRIDATYFTQRLAAGQNRAVKYQRSRLL